jgi:hypothetical protein
MSFEKNVIRKDSLHEAFRNVQKKYEKINKLTLEADVVSSVHSNRSEHHKMPERLYTKYKEDQ